PRQGRVRRRTCARGPPRCEPRRQPHLRRPLPRHPTARGIRLRRRRDTPGCLTMSTRRIAVVSAGLSTPSSTRMLADRMLSRTVGALAEKNIEVSADVIELRDLAHDITNNLLTGFAPPALETAINTVVSADALIVVTPIFSTSYSGLFKSFIDVLDPDALTGMPVLIGANAGTARHSLAIDYAIRPLFAYLHAEAVPTGVFAASSDWGS